MGNSDLTVGFAKINEICECQGHVLKLLKSRTIFVGFQTCVVFMASHNSDVAIFLDDISDLNVRGMPSLQLLDNDEVLCFQTSSCRMDHQCSLSHFGDFFVENTPPVASLLRSSYSRLEFGVLESFRLIFVSCRWSSRPLRPK